MIVVVSGKVPTPKRRGAPVSLKCFIRLCKHTPRNTIIPSSSPLGSLRSRSPGRQGCRLLGLGRS